MRRIFFDSLFASKCISCAALVVLAAGACRSTLEHTSIEIGGGMRKGDPPMCFQYRVESQPTMRAYNHILHINNSCRYAVDCVFHEDLTDQAHRIAQPAYQAVSYQLAEEVGAKRVDVDVECVWKP
jgi:hypothetical protein